MEHASYGQRKELPMAAPGLPETSTKAISPVGTVTPVDIDEFRKGSTPMEVDMFGDQYRNMDSSRYDAVTRGSASEPAYISTTAPDPESILAQNQSAYLEPEPTAAEPDFRQKYGQSENEKGEWRRVANEAQSMNQALLAQLAEITNRLTSAPQPQYIQPQPTGPPPRIYPEKAEGELMTWGEFEDRLRNDIVPDIVNRTNAAGQYAADSAAARAQRMLPQWDVTGLEENVAMNVLRQKYYNFDQRFTATEENDMLMTQVALTRARTGTNPGFSTPPTATAVGRVGGNGANPPTAPVMVDPNRVVRRATYIESAAPAQTGAEPSTTNDMRAKFQQELQQLDSSARAKTGRGISAIEMRELLGRYGIQQANDWGSMI